MRRIVTLVTALLMVLSVAAPAVAGVASTGTIDIVHGIPDTDVDVYVNDALLLEDFAFGTITDDQVLAAGSYAVDIFAANADPDVDMPVLSGTIELGPGMNVSAVAHLDGDGAPALSVFLNDESIVAGDNARLVVRHLAEAPNVDVRAGGAVLFGDVPNGASGTAEVAPGDYPVDLTLPGESDPVFDAGTLALAGGVAYTVYAVGTFPDTFTLLINAVDGLSPADAYGVVTVVHGIPGVTVDVYLNGGLAIPSFAPETQAGPLVLPATDYEVALYAEGADPLAEAPIVSAMTSLPAGANVSIVAWLSIPGPLGIAAGPAIGVFVNDVAPIADGNTRLTVRHLADAPNVDVRANGAPIFENVPNGASGAIDVAAGDYAVDLTLPGESDPVFDAGTLSLAAGTSYTVYAIGTFPDTFGLLIQTISGLGDTGNFSDDDGSVHEDAIDALAKAGVVLGKADGTYDDEGNLTRGQLASIIARTLGLSGGADAFTDDDGNEHEDAINALAAAGIAQGKADGTYGPNDPVSRGQVASLWARALGLVS